MIYNDYGYLQRAPKDLVQYVRVLLGPPAFGGLMEVYLYISLPSRVLVSG